MEFIEEIASLRDQISFDGTIDIPEDFDNVVIAGMGGSGIAGRIFQEWFTKKPVVLVNSYDIPEFVSKRTLFIAISYSGNTEETIHATLEAAKKGAKIRGISSGGKLAEIIDNTLIIPRSFQPRSAVGFLTVPLLRSFGLVNEEEIAVTKNLLGEEDQHTQEYQQIANDIFSQNKIPVIFGIPGLSSVAYRWKTQFNENAKVLAYSSSFPELNHNDTMALENTYRKGEFYFMVLRTKAVRKEISARIGITSKLCKIDMKGIEGEGNSLFSNIFTLIHKGDYISYFLAKMRGVDPKDVTIIESLKKEIGETK